MATNPDQADRGDDDRARAAYDTRLAAALAGLLVAEFHRRRHADDGDKRELDHGDDVTAA